MNNKYAQNTIYDANGQAKLKSGSVANAFLSRVFTIMTFGLGITGLSAWLFASKVLIDEFHAAEVLSGGLMWVLMLAPLAFVLIMSFAMHRMSYLVATIMFVAFAVVMGLSLSTIFIVYTASSIFQVFLIAGGTFAAMALIGGTTKYDLTKLGNILMIGVIGIIGATIVNWFMGSSGLDFIISIIGVVIFAGLTAYDTQKLLRIGAQVGTEGETAGKFAIMGALSLYLDFINLFLFLLRLLGGRD